MRNNTRTTHDYPSRTKMIRKSHVNRVYRINSSCDTVAHEPIDFVVAEARSKHAQEIHLSALPTLQTVASSLVTRHLFVRKRREKARTLLESLHFRSSPKCNITLKTITMNRSVHLFFDSAKIDRCNAINRKQVQWCAVERIFGKKSPVHITKCMEIPASAAYIYSYRICVSNQKY